MLDLMRWGSRWMTRPEPDTVVRASWFALALKSLLPPASVGDAHGDIELVAEDEVIHLRVADGTIAVSSEPVESPDARLTADPRTLFRIGSGASSLAAEVDAGRAHVDGGEPATRLLERVLRFG